MNKTTIVYARYSSHQQTEQSIDGQLRVCKEFAQRNGYTIIGEYIDRAASGTNDKRPEFQRMLSDATAGTFEYVLVYQYDRFARNRRDSLNNKHHLSKYHVKLISATEPMITDDPANVFIEGMLETVAEYYSRDLAMKTKRGIQESINKKQSLGGSHLLGYTTIDKKYTIIEEEAQVVRLIFDKFNNGEKIKDIISFLNSNNYKKKGKTFSRNSLQHLLDNPKYMGKFIYNGQEIDGVCPAIIDERTFLLAQERLGKYHYKKKGREKLANADYLLSGRIFCGYCGTPLVASSGYGRNGTKHCYYRCKTKECKKETEPKERIERFVVDKVSDFLSDTAFVDRLAQEMVNQLKEQKTHSEVKTLENKISQLTRSINKAIDSFIDATPLVRESINKKVEEMTQAKAELEVKLKKLKLVDHKKLYDTKFIVDWIRAVMIQKSDNVEFAKRVCRYFVNSVHLFDDEMIIYLNIENCEVISHIEMLQDHEKMDKTKTNHVDGSCKVSNGDAYGIRTRECMRERHVI